MAKNWSGLQKTRFPGIRRDENGAYVIQARVKEDRTGRMVERNRTLVPEASLEYALAERAMLVRSIREGTYREGEAAETTTLGDYARRWIVRKRDEGLREHTITHYLAVLKMHILPILGDLLVTRLAPRDIIRWQDWAASKLMRSGKAYSRWSVNSWTTVLRTFISDATVEFELPRNPCQGVRGVRKPRSPRASRRLDAEQLREFLRLVKVHCPQHHAIALMLAVYGLRWEEASGLHLDHIDEENMELRIVQAHVRKKIYPTKNEGHKLLPLHQEVLGAIKAEQERLRVEKNPGLKEGKLFPGRNGEYRVPSSVAKGWKAVSEEMKLKFIVTPHDLRRTYQNLLRQASVGMVVQQALMGHSSDGMTLHYSHVDMAEKRQAHEGVLDLLKYREKKEESG